MNPFVTVSVRNGYELCCWAQAALVVRRSRVAPVKVGSGHTLFPLYGWLRVDLCGPAVRYLCSFCSLPAARPCADRSSAMHQLRWAGGVMMRVIGLAIGPGFAWVSGWVFVGRARLLRCLPFRAGRLPFALRTTDELPQQGKICTCEC